MKRTLNFLGIVMGLALVVTPAASAQAINSNVGTVSLQANLPESLTLNVTAGGTVTFGLTANTAANPGGTTSTVQTAWVLSPGRTVVSIFAYVNTTGAALTAGGGNNIPASAVKATASGSGSAGGLLSTTAGGGVGSVIPSGGSGVQIGSVAITGLNKASSTTTTLTWSIDTTFNPQLPAGTYTGTVNIQAQATP
jgi:hypothetical protein